MKTKFTLILLLFFLLFTRSFGQIETDTLTNNSNKNVATDTLATNNNTIIENENTPSANENTKNWELRGNVRELGKLFSESPNETDLLESRLKLELISTLGKKTAFRAVSYTTYNSPGKELKFDLKEAYLDYYTKFIDFRIGQQVNTWGKADEINPTDILNPQDMNNITEDKSLRKIGLFQLKADVKFFDFVLTGIWKPAFEYFKVPSLDSRWAFFSIPNITTLPQAVYPENKIKNTEWALKLARTISSIDFSLSYFDGWDNIFTPSMGIDAITQKPYLKELITHRTKMFGADFATSIASLGFWGEGAYFLTEDEDGTDQFIKNPYFQYVIGTDYEFKYKIKFNLQYFQEVITKTDDDAEKTSEENMLSKLGIGLPLQQALTCRLEKKFGQAEEFKFEIFTIYDLKHNGAMVIPKFFYSPEDGFNIEMGYTLFDGISTSFWSRFQHNDQYYLKLIYSF